MLLILIGGIATAFNYLILLYKFKNKLYKSFFMDLGSFMVLNIVFLGTLTGMSIAMVASFIISVLTLPKPQIKFPKIKINKISLPNIDSVVGVVLGSLAVLTVLVVL